MKRRYQIFGIFLVTVAVAQSSVLAQTTPDRTPTPAIRVTGEATITANPDQVQIDIGVVSQAQSAEAAASENARKVDEVLKELRSQLGPSAEIKTISYSLNPNYVYPRDGGRPRIDGYIASNILQVKTNELDRAGKIIDAAIRAGANNIHALRFTLRDEQAMRSRALSEAASKARAKAQVLATALNVKIVRILSVEEGGSFASPPEPRIFARAEGAAVQTPVEPGTIEIRATVALTVEVEN